VPAHELTTEELINFWADDHLDAEAAGSRMGRRGGEATA
jgi:hypothetical protein